MFFGLDLEKSIDQTPVQIWAWGKSKTLVPQLDISINQLHTLVLSSLNFGDWRCLRRIYGLFVPDFLFFVNFTLWRQNLQLVYGSYFG